MNVKWSIPDEADDNLHMQDMWDWLCDDWNIHLLNMPATQIMVNAVTREVPFTWEPHITLLLQKQGTVLEALSHLWSHLPLVGLNRC